MHAPGALLKRHLSIAMYVALSLSLCTIRIYYLPPASARYDAEGARSLPQLPLLRYWPWLLPPGQALLSLASLR